MYKLAFALLLATLPLAELRALPIESYTMDFEVRDPKTKEVYFRGQEKVSTENNIVRKEALYFDNSKKEVQKELFLFEAESLRILEYSASNHLTGGEILLKAKDKGIEVQYRQAKGKDRDNKFLKGSEGAYIGKMAYELIQKNWDLLLMGKLLKFDLLVPDRLETIPFQFVRRDSRKVGNETHEVFALIPQNLFIRALAPTLEFHFNQEKKIRQASFPIWLPIKDQTNRMVEMVFKY